MGIHVWNLSIKNHHSVPRHIDLSRHDVKAFLRHVFTFLGAAAGCKEKDKRAEKV